MAAPFSCLESFWEPVLSRGAMDVRTRGVCRVLLVLTALVSPSFAEPELKVIGCGTVIRCAHTAAIVACQFKSFPDGGVVEPSNPNSEWLHMSTVALTSGTCSVTLSGKFQTGVAYLIACRMQEAVNGPWIQKEEILYRNNDTLELKPLTTTLTTSLTTGVGSLMPSVTATATFTNCTFLVPGERKTYPGAISAGVSCRTTIAVGNSSDEAVVVARVFSAGIYSWALAAGMPTVIEPKLTLPNVTTLSAGDVYNASCRVAANSVAVWTLDSQTIYEANCFRSNEWSWSFQNSKPFVATFNRPLTWEYNGRRLGCHMKTTPPSSVAIDTSSTPLVVRFAPYLTGFTWNRTSGDFLEATVRVAANPSAMISWTIGDLQGDEMPMETASPGHFEGFKKIGNASMDSLTVSVTLKNDVGSTTSQLLICPPSDTTWLLVLIGVLGALCLVLLVAVLVLVLPRWWSTKSGASRRLKEGSDRRVVKSGLYAEAEDPVEYDDIGEYDDIWEWQPEYEDVDLPMRPSRNLAA